MTVEALLAYLGVVIMVVLIPGADFAIVLRNTITGGRPRGLATATGIGIAAMLQGAAAAAGLAALITASQPLFQLIKWLGICFLAYLACQAVRSAWLGRYPQITAPSAGSAWTGFRQGLLCNATNPKIAVFYLALLPQFLSPVAPLWASIGLAWLLPVIGTGWLMIIVAAAARARAVLLRRRIRRTLDAATGATLAIFAIRVATDRS